MANHLMIDLETLGTEPGCAVLTIGGVVFNEKFETLYSFYYLLDWEKQLEEGYRVSGSTLEWWMKQDRKAFLEALGMLDESTDLLDNLGLKRELRSFIDLQDIKYLWGNSASFDLGILKSLVGRGIWNEFNERCYRTMVAHYPIAKKMVKRDSAHHALADAKYQVEVLKCVFNHFSMKLE